MARRRGYARFDAEETATPLQTRGAEEMTMHRHTHTIPVAPTCCGTEQQLQKLYQAFIVQNDVIIEMLSVIQELLATLKTRENGPGQ